jgi:hypothetical protein
MRKTTVSIQAGALLLATGSFAADEKEGKIQQRKENQQKRIAEGVKNGSLTPAETARIEHQESKLNKEVRRDRKQNDGKLTPQEKAKVNRQQNKLSKEIAKQKHDGQTQK